MTEVDWESVVKSVVATSVQTLVGAANGTELLGLLTAKGPAGLSFSQIKEATNLNPGSLNNQLGLLEKGGLIENLLERRDGSRDYSFYRATPLGETLLNEFEVFLEALERQVVASSPAPEMGPLRRPGEQVVSWKMAFEPREVKGWSIITLATGGFFPEAPGKLLGQMSYQPHRPGLPQLKHPSGYLEFQPWGAPIDEFLLQKPIGGAKQWGQ